MNLCNESTLVVMSYEERKTGNKPEIEKRFFEVVIISLIQYYAYGLQDLFAANGKAVYTQSCTS